MDRETKLKNTKILASLMLAGKIEIKPIWENNKLKMMVEIKKMELVK